MALNSKYNIESEVQANWDGSKEIDLSNNSFTFALIDDLPEVLNQFAKQLSMRLGLDPCVLALTLKAQFQVLRDEIQLAIQRAFIESDEWSAQPRRQDRFKVLTLDQQELLIRMPESSQTEKELSLSPVLAERRGLALWDFARLFSLSGTTQIGFTPRFGTAISSQLKALVENYELSSTNLTLVDDHVVTGSTIKRAAELLERLGITTQRVLALTQIGSASSIKIDPVVRFIAPGQDPLSRMDLVDLVDFIIGFGGCWVRLAGGEIGQLPYCLPFADPVKRASIPKSNAETFSLDILKANLKFIEEIEKACGAQILLKDCSPAFARYYNSTLGSSNEDRLATLIKVCIDTRFPSGNVKTFSDKAEYSQLSELELPGKLIFLDVNSTLFAPGESTLDPLLLREFKELVKKVRQQGVEIGLCSDSPLQGLKRLAADLDLDGPILAELGSVVGFKNCPPLILRKLENIAQLKQKIREFALESKVTETAERWAVEFGGSNDLPEGSWFAFGAERASSIAIFGSQNFIQSIKGCTNQLREVAAQNIAIDISLSAGPYAVAIIHPLESIADAKGEILAVIARLGADVTMIGDSTSDLVPLQRNLRTILVGNSKVSCETAERVKFPFLAGVLAGINKTLERGKVEEARNE